MKNTPALDCKNCVVSRYASNQDSFCQRCCNRADAKQYCIALHDQRHGLTPFVALNDRAQAEIYAERLELRGVSHLLMRWNPDRRLFSEVKEQLQPRHSGRRESHQAAAMA